MMEATQKINSQSIVNPQKFVVWLLIISIIMLFAGLTSGYIVRRGTGEDWISQALPLYFTVSTIIALVSSITMYLAVHTFKRKKLSLTSVWCWVSVLRSSRFWAF